MEPSDLSRRARRAYELGRLRAGLRATWPLLFIAPIALAMRGAPAAGATLVAAAGLAALVVALVWRGGALARGVALGFLAGLPLLLVPAVWMAIRSPTCAECEMMGMGLAGDLWHECLLVCAGAGLVAGALVGLRSVRTPDGARYGLSAALVAGATGALGCALVGLIGVLATFGGLALGALPPLLLRLDATSR